MNILRRLVDLFCVLLICAFCEIILHSTLAAEGPPRKLAIADHMRIMFAETNQTYTLKCPIEKRKDSITFVEWSKGDKSFYQEEGYEETPKGNLRIKSVKKQHAGVYTCEGINGFGSVRVNMTLIVDNPETEYLKEEPTNPNSANRVVQGCCSPPSIKKRPFSNIVDEIGGQATFHCVASGQPNPHIFWLKDGNLIEGAETEVLKGSTHSSLKLRGLKKSDAGIYTCIARNKRGVDQLDFKLKVTDLSSPPRIVSLQPVSATIEEGATAVFWCEADSKPGVKLRIKWLKRIHTKDVGHQIKLDDMTLFRSGTTYFRPLNFSEGTNTNEGVYKSKLMIRNSCKEDSGTYVCLALNDKGFNFKNVTLTVIGTTTTLSSLHYFPTSSTSLVVTITILFVVILAAVVFVSHLYCRGKPSSKEVDISALEKNNEENKTVKQNVASARTYNKKDIIIYAEMNEPQPTSKLLSSNLCL